MIIAIVVESVCTGSQQVSDLSFADLVSRVRQGDQDAASELVRRYEPAIRRTVRFRLSQRMGKLFDSMDICQSVMASFFVRAASGQYELHQPEELLKLLISMARNKVAFHARAQQAQRRDHRRVSSSSDFEGELPCNAATPSQNIAAQELLQAVHSRLSPDERELVRLRNDGVEWADIASQLGGSPEALRKKLARALDRVSEQLGLDELP